MQARLRKRTRQFGGNTNILHNERIHAGTIRLAHDFHGTCDFAFENHRVERQIYLHVAQMSVITRGTQRFQREIVGSAPRIKRIKPQVNGIGTGANGSAQGVKVACRGK